MKKNDRLARKTKMPKSQRRLFLHAARWVLNELRSRPIEDFAVLNHWNNTGGLAVVEERRHAYRLLGALAPDLCKRSRRLVNKALCRRFGVGKIEELPPFDAWNVSVFAWNMLGAVWLVCSPRRLRFALSNAAEEERATFWEKLKTLASLVKLFLPWFAGRKIFQEMFEGVKRWLRQWFHKIKEWKDLLCHCYLMPAEAPPAGVR